MRFKNWSSGLWAFSWKSMFESPKGWKDSKFRLLQYDDKTCCGNILYIITSSSFFIIKKNCMLFIFKHNFQKSFQRDSFLDWSPYTHLNLRLRGDGRSYLINIHVSGQFDIMWNDVFTFVLYTRGGPYWQTTRVSNNIY